MSAGSLAARGSNMNEMYEQCFLYRAETIEKNLSPKHPYG